MKQENLIISLYVVQRHYIQLEIGEIYGCCLSTTGYQIRRTLQLLHKEMDVTRFYGFQ